MNGAHLETQICEVRTVCIPLPNEGTRGQTYVLNSFPRRILFGYSRTYSGQIQHSYTHLGFDMGWNSKDLLK